MYRRTAHTQCPDGPCPVMAIDEQRQKTALQGYDPENGSASLDDAMGPQPPGEPRIEMDTATHEWLLAQHLTDDAIQRILAMRTSMRATV